MSKSNDSKWEVYPVDLFTHVISEFHIYGEYREDFLRAVFDLVSRLKESKSEDSKEV